MPDRIIKAKDLDTAEARADQLRRSRPLSDETNKAVAHAIEDSFHATDKQRAGVPVDIGQRMHDAAIRREREMRKCFITAALIGAVYECRCEQMPCVCEGNGLLEEAWLR